MKYTKTRHTTTWFPLLQKQGIKLSCIALTTLSNTHTAFICHGNATPHNVTTKFCNHVPKKICTTERNVRHNPTLLRRVIWRTPFSIEYILPKLGDKGSMERSLECRVETVLFPHLSLRLSLLREQASRLLSSCKRRKSTHEPLHSTSLVHWALIRANVGDCVLKTHVLLKCLG